MKFRVDALVLSPLSFRTGRNTIETETHRYISGTALLASLVDTHHLLRQDADELGAMFLNDTTRIGNLYPAIPSGPQNGRVKWPKWATNKKFPVYPLPTTARSCKRFGGFRSEGAQKFEKHGVHDHLCNWGLFELSEHNMIEPLERHKECAYVGCEQTIDRIDGFYRRGDAQDHWAKSSAKTILRMHTGIERRTGTVKQGILYGRSAIAEGTEFWGTWQVPDEIGGDFEDFIEGVNEARLIRVGNNRTRGLGKLQLEVNQYVDVLPDLQTRIETFDAHFRAMADSFCIPTPHALYVPITLTSDVILLDHLLRHYLTISPPYLADTWGLQGAELIHSNITTRRVQGWNMMLGVPKPDDVAIGMGSVFLFGFPSSLDEARLKTLAKMEAEGLGLRRREGFGQIIIASQFHYEVDYV